MKMMNIAIVMISVLGLTYGTIVCKVTAEGAETDVTCEVGDEVCSVPKFTEYTGHAGVYGCGACGAASDCTECTPVDNTTPCTGVEVGDNFECYGWTFSEGENGVWTQAETATVCHRLADTAVVCNAPDYNSAAMADYTMKNVGCGPCDSDEKTAGHCNECGATKCNSSSFLTGSLLLAALSSLVFLM